MREARPWLALATYTLLTALLQPLALLLLTLRGRHRGEPAGRWWQRLGWAPRQADGIPVWVHAASVGEVRAAAPIIAALLARHGDGRVLLTTLTATGAEEAQRAWGDRVRHAYLPFDMPGNVRRFLDRSRPRLAMIMETELWPNLYAALAARGIPLLIANARLSPDSMRRYRRVAGLVRAVLGHCTLVAAQSQADAERFRMLGARRVEVMGNVKFDVEVPEAQRREGEALRQRLGATRPVWIAASTRDGEEEMVLEAHRAVLGWQPQALLILVPRHPQRFAGVARGLARSGLRWLANSELLAGRAPGDCQVLLGDSMGEMFRYLAAADVAFVGGSLVEVGGHNLLEPAALGLPVLFGPHMFNFFDARRLLLEVGAGREVPTPGALAAEVAALLATPTRRAAMGAAGREAIETNRGAVARLLDYVPDSRP